MNHKDFPQCDFIKVVRNSLSSDFCNHVIEKFENDPRSSPGRVAGGLDLDTKKSDDLCISRLPDWSSEDSEFFNALGPALSSYFDYHSEHSRLDLSDVYDTGYQIQRTGPDGGYVWHNDAHILPTGDHRVATYIWYLNTVTEGGFTEFVSGKKVQPEQGKLLLFPATWCFVHRGIAPVVGEKYICTGWVYSRPVSYSPS